jgi:hypothetical protein
VIDLKIIDELLLDYMLSKKLMPHDLEMYSTITSEAICRLRKAWDADEMLYITKTWADYFEETS